MINTIEEFAKEHDFAAIVNYDAKDLFEMGCGLTYKTGPKTLERFRKDRGKYIDYPKIQPYSELNGNYEIFIIHNHKMYKLESYNGNYRIKEEIENINPKIYMDDVFCNHKNLKNPTIINEKILEILE